MTEEQVFDVTSLILIPIFIGVVISLAGLAIRKFGVVSEGILTGKIRLDAVINKVDKMAEDLNKANTMIRDMIAKIEFTEYRLKSLEDKVDKLLNQGK